MNDDQFHPVDTPATLAELAAQIATLRAAIDGFVLELSALDEFVDRNRDAAEQNNERRARDIARLERQLDDEREQCSLARAALERRLDGMTRSTAWGL